MMDGYNFKKEIDLSLDSFDIEGLRFVDAVALAIVFQKGGYVTVVEQTADGICRVIAMESEKAEEREKATGSWLRGGYAEL